MSFPVHFELKHPGAPADRISDISYGLDDMDLYVRQVAQHDFNASNPPGSGVVNDQLMRWFNSVSGLGDDVGPLVYMPNGIDASRLEALCSKLCTFN